MSAAAATAPGGRAGLGWLILVAALAVPGVLFYNWWSHLKAEREKSVAAKARGRAEGVVFQQAPPDARLVNPMSPPVSTAAAAAPVVSTAAAPAPVSAAPSPVPDAAAAAPAAPAEAPAAPAEAPAVSSAAYVPLKRDPMLSPFDHVRLMEEAEAKEAARRRLEDEKNRKTRVVVRREPPPETRVELQGIIANAEGESKAIVSDQIVGVGETVNNCRVLKITAQGVLFEYKGKRFTKSVNRE